MNWLEGISVTTMLLILFLGIVPIVIVVYLFFYDRRQKQYAILRNYPILGRMRYMLEKTGPELRQYLFGDEYLHMVLPGKYLTMREGLFRVAAAAARAGVDSPTKLERHHVLYKDERGRVYPIE